MQYGIVLGTVTATQKVKDLHGIPMKVLIACDEKKDRKGDPFVAVDSIGARPGDCGEQLD